MNDRIAKILPLLLMASFIILECILIHFDLDRCGEAILGILIADVVIMVQFVLYLVSCLKVIRDSIKEKKAEKEGDSRMNDRIAKILPLLLMASFIILGCFLIRFDLAWSGEATLVHLIAAVVMMVQFVLYSVSCIKAVRDSIKEKKAEK